LALPDHPEHRHAALEHRARQHPTDADACRELAKVLEAEGDLHGAARAQRQAAARRPDRPWDRFLAAKLVVSADATRERNPKLALPPEELDEVRLPAAEEASLELRLAIELDPDFGAAWRELARLDTSRARVLRDEAQAKAAAERALSRGREALRLDPQDAECHRVLGDVHYHVLRDLRGARAHYEEALAIEPGHVEARAMLAATFLREGDSEAAFREITQALSADPENHLANEILKDIR
jgi:tetratricopeptide (TPR) repeat protein